MKRTGQRSGNIIICEHQFCDSDTTFQMRRRGATPESSQGIHPLDCDPRASRRTFSSKLRAVRIMANVIVLNQCVANAAAGFERPGDKSPG